MSIMDRMLSASRPVRIAGRLAPVGARALRGVRWLLSTARKGASGAARRWAARPGGRRRDLRRRASKPLPNLYVLYPDVRRATPREIGLRSIDIDDIVGTAVAGAAQRGADFLPLKPFRSQNWSARWQRILRAIDNLAILPPVDLVRYDGKYWVLDGHNRVAAAHYVGQVEVDANITELVPPGQNPSERPGNLAAALTGTQALRAAGQGGRLRTMRDDEVSSVRPGDFDGAAASASLAAGPVELVAPAPEPPLSGEFAANEGRAVTAEHATPAAEPPPAAQPTATDDPPDPEAKHDTGAPPALP